MSQKPVFLLGECTTVPISVIHDETHLAHMHAHTLVYERVMCQKSCVRQKKIGGWKKAWKKTAEGKWKEWGEWGDLVGMAAISGQMIDRQQRNARPRRPTKEL